MKKAISQFHKRITSKMSLFTSLTVFIIGILIGALTTWYFAAWHYQSAKIAWYMVRPWSGPIMKVTAMAILIGRVFVSARWKREEPLDYSTLTFWGGFWANLVTVVLSAALIILVFSMAPDVLLTVRSYIK